MEQTRYCLCCDENVPFSIVERVGQREITCAFCGFTLDIEKLHDLAKTHEMGVALVAEDSSYTRKIIHDLILEKQYSEKVMGFENGLDLVSSYGKLLAEKRQADVAIIDLNMPVMDGMTAARTLRALETQNNASKVPIVFFSAEKADEAFKHQMQSLEPANYVNKGQDADPDKLAARVETLLMYLMEKYKRPAV